MAELGTIGTPLSDKATRVLFCGAGELGKEVIIEMMRSGFSFFIIITSVSFTVNDSGLLFL